VVGSTVACFGEVLLRLTAPQGEPLAQASAFRSHVGGAEANVAVSLALLGHPTVMLTVLPENPLGQFCAAELRRHGVDTRAVRFEAGRMGLYFVEQGAGMRPPRVLYDREGSAFALSLSEGENWDEMLAAGDWLHLSGVVAGLGRGAARSLIRLARAAYERGTRISFDCNYRPSLWRQWDGNAGEIFREIVGLCELLFAGKNDFALMFGSDQSCGTDETEAFSRGALTALSRFERLRYVATTMRERSEFDDHSLSALVMSRDGLCTARWYPLGRIVDRIGSGDAFAAGMLHAVIRGFDAQRAVDFAAAAACVKHTIAGDANLATAADIEAVLRGEFELRR
jgi:2-dehydro-3-deoxygluconokinase